MLWNSEDEKRDMNILTASLLQRLHRTNRWNKTSKDKTISTNMAEKSDIKKKKKREREGEIRNNDHFDQSSNSCM